jgi:hypothetical protein
VEDGYQQRMLPPAPIEITLTIYPEHPSGNVNVPDAVNINISSAEFVEFRETVGRLCVAIEQSNEVSRETVAKFAAELQAGLKIIEGPKPSRKLIDLLLTHPLPQHQRFPELVSWRS